MKKAPEQELTKESWRLGFELWLDYVRLFKYYNSLCCFFVVDLT